jgi:uncharacterized protein
MSIDYEWDRTKARANLRKHGVDFGDAATAFADAEALTIPDNDEDEDRFATIAMDALGRILVVVFTWRGQRIRIISARRASSQERRQYLGEI